MLNEISEARSAKQRAQGEERARSEAEAARGRLTPLDERLGRLLATIPAEMQREGISLVALQASLRGRRRGSCHPGDLGAALRRAGFARSRNWRGTDGFNAIWRKQA